MPLSSQGCGIPANLKKLTNVQLVQIIANEPCNEEAWREFLHRFHKYVSFTIYSACKRLGYAEGVAKVEDLAQEVYIKLLNNNCEPLKRFTSLYENAILKYLKITAIRAVHTDFTTWKAQKRQPAGGIVSLDRSAEWTINENKLIC
jgi:DNA-directed RNA polymerase specialized sigma24 family protein